MKINRYGPRGDWLYGIDPDTGEQFPDTEHLVFYVEARGSDNQFHGVSVSSDIDTPQEMYEAWFLGAEASLRQKMIEKGVWAE